MRSVGVMGDGRTYDYTLALRGVTTTDFMTADFAKILISDFPDNPYCKSRTRERLSVNKHIGKS